MVTVFRGSLADERRNLSGGNKSVPGSKAPDYRPALTAAIDFAISSSIVRVIW